MEGERGSRRRKKRKVAKEGEGAESFEEGRREGDGMLYLEGSGGEGVD